MQDKISVIIPAYNCEKTIGRCVTSIINSTYKNLEIIVVNDGSTDNTLTELQEIQKNDNRINIITIPNGGVSHARNIGIDNASGNYITFVDSDDTIENNMYQELLALIKNYNVKIAHCSYNNVLEDGSINCVGNKGKQVLQNHDEAMTCLITGDLFTGGIWNKLYDISLFNDVRLDEQIKFNEDVLLNFLLFNKIEKSVYTDKCFYNYYANTQSATHSANAVRAGKECFYVSEKICEMSLNKAYEQDSVNRLAYTAIVLYRAYIFDSTKDNKIERKELKFKIKNWKKDKVYTRKEDKITVLMYMYIPHIYKLLYTFYDKLRVKKLDPEQ